MECQGSPVQFYQVFSSFSILQARHAGVQRAEYEAGYVIHLSRYLSVSPFVYNDVVH